MEEGNIWTLQSSSRAFPFLWENGAYKREVESQPWLPSGESSVLTASVVQVGFLVMEPHHLFVNCHAVVVAHIEELEWFTTRIYNYVLEF